jgi:O-antigen ligase
MDVVSQFLQVASSPVGILVFVFGGGFVLTSKASQRPLHWLLFALCTYGASLSLANERYGASPPLAFPLEQLRNIGRPITIFLLLLLLVLALRSKQGWRKKLFPAPLFMLFVLQGILISKVLLEGDLAFGLLSTVTYCTAIVVVVLGPGRWLQDEFNFRWGMGALVAAGTLFLIASLYQASIDPYPIMHIHGLLTGTTGNPQHAATLLVATVPAILFLLFLPDQPAWQRGAWLLLLVGTLYALILTGSRTGLLSVIVAFAVFFWQRLGNGPKFAFLILIVLALSFDQTILSLGNSLASDAVGSFAPEKLTRLQNTRAQVWQAQWNQFTNYPVFGAPLRGDRLGFGENSWLAVGAAAGIIGLIPLSLFAYQCGKFMMRLYRMGKRHPEYSVHCNAVTAGLASLLFGSIAEAYLLGLITFPLLAISLYLILGQYLLDINAYYRPSTRQPLESSV